MMPSENPRSSITQASSVYITPIRLWSTLVIHSLQRYGRWPRRTIQASIARIATSTTAPERSGSGWSKGMAAQVSLPSIAGSDIGSFLRTGARRDLLGRDRLEQLGIVELENQLVLRHRLLEQFLVAVGIQRAVALHRSRSPAQKLRLRDDADVEHHIGKTVTTEMRRQALIAADLVGAQFEPRHHPVHGVNHAAELRDEERVHHAPRRQLQMQRRADRHHQRVDGRNALVRIDEQPFPVE